MSKCSKCGMLKILKTKINQITPQVYAALALALHRKYGWGYKRINALFEESGTIWQECINGDVNMIKMCEDETNIRIVDSVLGGEWYETYRR